MTPKKRAVIIPLQKEGLSYREISRRVGVSKSTVERAIRLVNETGQYATRKRTGRPRVTTKRDDIAIKRAVEKNPFISSAEIKTEMTSLQASSRTIRRRLFTDFKLPCRRAAKKPMLTEQQRKKRLTFCRKYKNWTVRDW